jgi:hypothetical protein
MDLEPAEQGFRQAQRDVAMVFHVFKCITRFGDNYRFLNTTTASGGNVTAMLLGRLCRGMGREETRPTPESRTPLRRQISEGSNRAAYGPNSGAMFRLPRTTRRISTSSSSIR